MKHAKAVKYCESPSCIKMGNSCQSPSPFLLLFGVGHQLAGIAAVIRDNTDAFLEERALHKRVAELEKTIGAQLQIPSR